MTCRQRIGAALGCLALILGFFAPFSFLPPEAQRALGTALFAVLIWTFEPVPIELSSLLLLLLMPAAGLLSFEESFAPFAGKTVWLIFAGMILSQGIAATGLDDSLAAGLLPRLDGSPFRLLLYLHLIGLAAAFIIPSGVVRVLLLMPIGAALTDRLSTDQRGDLDAAILLSLLCSTYYGGCGVLTGSVPNLVVAGQLERMSGEIIYWSTWLQWMFPVIGLLRTGLSLAVIWCLFGRRLVLPPPQGRTVSGLSMRADQRRVAGILLLGVSLWATDLFHHLSPAYVGLLLVILYLLPGWGPIPFSSIRQTNFPFLFYIAALFSLGTALEASDFNNRLILALTPLADLGTYGWFGQHIAITLLTVPFDFLMDIAAVAGVLTPAMLELGRAYGMADLPVAMSVGMATSLVFLPYQAAPFMVALGFRRFSLGRLLMVMLAISLLSLLLLVPLNVASWRWRGLI